MSPRASFLELKSITLKYALTTMKESADGASAWEGPTDRAVGAQCAGAGLSAAASASPRRFLNQRGTQPVIPNNPTRKHSHPVEAAAYKQRNLIERMFCHLKVWCRIATRYDNLAANFAAAVAIATIILW